MAWHQWSRPLRHLAPQLAVGPIRGPGGAVGRPWRISTPQSVCREECYAHQREDSARTVEVVVG